jgi:hypothetical protein
MGVFFILFVIWCVVGVLPRREPPWKDKKK